MKGVERYHRQMEGYPKGVLVFEIDGNKAEYKGIPARTLGAFGQRKLENIIFMQNANEKLPMKFIHR